MIHSDRDYIDLKVICLFRDDYEDVQTDLNKILPLQKPGEFRIYEIQHNTKNDYHYVWIYYFGEFPEWQS